MFTIEMLRIDWNDRDRSAVVHSIASQALGDAAMVAKTLLDSKNHSYNASRIKDAGGNVILRSWERSL